MATVEQQIAVRIRAIVSGLSQVQALSASVKDLNTRRGSVSGLARTASDTSLLAANANAAVRSVAPLFATVKDLSGAFATGQLNIKNFSSELGNAARKIKPITDASRLLSAATGSIATSVGSGGGAVPLPSRNNERITLKPLIADTVKVNEGITGTVRNVARLTTGTKQAKDAIAQLADQWIKGDSVTRKGIEGLLKSFDAVRVARFNALIGGSAGTTGSFSTIKQKVDSVLPDEGDFQKRLLRFDTLIDAFIRKQRQGKATAADSDLLTRRAGLLGFSSTDISSRIKGRDSLIPDLDNANRGARGLVQQFNTATSAVFRLRAAIALVAAAITALAAAGGIYLLARGIGEVIQQGIRFNQVLEDAKIGLAGIISNNFEIRDANGDLVEGAEAYAAGLSLAQGQMGKLRAATIETAFEFEHLLNALTQASSAVAGTNTNLDQTVALVVKLSRVASAINLSPSELATQSRQVLTGATRVQTRLAQALFPGQDATAINKQIKAFREAGTLVEELEKRMAAFQFAAKDIENTLTALADNAKDAFSFFAGEATLELFDGIKAALKFIREQVVIINDDGVKLTPTFQKFADIFNVISGTVGERLVGVVRSVFGGLERWVDSFNANEKSLRVLADAAFEVGRQIVLWVGDILQFFNLINSGGPSVIQMAVAFQALAATIALIRDYLAVLKGTLQVIASGPLFVVASLFEAIAQVVDLLVGRVTRFSEVISGVRQDLQGIFSSGLGNILSFGSRTGEVVKGVKDGYRLRGEVGGSFEPGFSATPVRTPGGGSGDKGRAAKEALRSRRQLLDALAKLQEARAKRELDLARDTNESLRQINQRLYDDNLKAVQDFQFEKFKLDKADLEAEKKFLAEKKRIAQGSLQREVGNIFGADSVSADRLNDLTKLAAGDVSKLSKQQSDAVKLIVDFKREELEIDTQIQQLAIKGLQLNRENNAEVARGLRTRKQILGDVNAELADSLGNAGVGQANDLNKRISDEFGRVLLDTNALTPEIEILAEQVREMGTVDLDLLTGAMEFLGIEVKSLSPETQKLILLFQRLQASAKFEGLTSDIDKGFDRLSRVASQVEADFGSGKIGLEDALDRIRSANGDELPTITAGIQRLRELMKPVLGKSLFSESERAAVEAYLREVEKATQGITEFGLAAANTRRGEEAADAKIVAIQNQRRAGTLNQIDAEDQMIAVKQELIGVLERELALLQAAASLTPEQTQRAIDLTNQIANLRNEQNASILDFKEGVEGSISNAFQTFFDSVLTGNQSILDSFRSVVSQMLIEIGKLIFQAFVLKQVMSLVQGFLGGIGGGLSGGSGAAGGASQVGFIGAGYADGGYTGDGPTMAPAGIVHRGEYVIPASRVRQVGLGYLNSLKSGAFLPRLRGYASGGLVGEGSGQKAEGSRGAGVRIVNLLDKGLFNDFLNSSEGEQTIVNIMSKNSQMLTRLA